MHLLKALLVCSVLLSNLATAQEPEAPVKLADIVSKRAQGPLQVTPQLDCSQDPCRQEILISGSYVSRQELAQAFDPVFLSLKQPLEQVRFDTWGGNVAAAVELGRFLQQKNIDTLVAKGDTCASSCVYMLAGGKRRTIKEGAYLGVHRFTFTAKTKIPEADEAQLIVLNVMLLLHTSGINQELMMLMLNTPVDQMRSLNVSCSQILNLDNTSAKPAKGQGWCGNVDFH